MISVSQRQVSSGPAPGEVVDMAIRTCIVFPMSNGDNVITDSER